MEDIVHFILSRPSTNLRYLNLSWNEISIKGAYILAKCLKRNGEEEEEEDDDEKLKEKKEKVEKKDEALKPEKNPDLGQQATRILLKTKEEHKRAKIPPKCPITHLNIHMNPSLTDDVCSQIFKSLKHNTIMTTLTMSACQVSTLSVAELCEVLMHNQTLSNIDLSCNPINEVQF